MGNKSSLMLQDEEIKQVSHETGFSAQQIEKLYTRFTHLDRGNCGSLSKNDLLSIPELAINPLCGRLIEMFFSSRRRAGARRVDDNQLGVGVGMGEHHHHDDDDDDDQRINFRQFMRVLAAFRTSQHHLGRSSSGQLAGAESAGGFANRPRTVSGPAGLAALQAAHLKQKPLWAQGRETTNASSMSTTRDLLDLRNELARQGRGRTASTNSALVDSLGDLLRDKLYFLFRIYDADDDGRISFKDLKSVLKMMVGNYIEEVQLDKIATRAFVELDQDNDGFVEFSEFCRVFAGKDMDDKLRVRFF